MEPAPIHAFKVGDVVIAPGSDKRWDVVAIHYDWITVDNVQHTWSAEFDLFDLAFHLRFAESWP